jgi:hypothetical protein
VAETRKYDALGAITCLYDFAFAFPLWNLLRRIFPPPRPPPLLEFMSYIENVYVKFLLIFFLLWRCVYAMIVIFIVVPSLG